LEDAMGERKSLNRGPHFEYERLDPEAADAGNVSFSLSRYRFARPYAVGKTILDAGCGTGYGSHLLAQAARCVVGVDYDAEVIRRAPGKYPSANLVWAASDVTALPFGAASFDLVVSFEVVEHLPNHDAHQRFFNEILRVLASDGIFIISTSNRDVTVPHQRSVGIVVDAHLTEMDTATFRQELNRTFAVDFFGGMRYQGNVGYRFLRGLDTHNLRLRVPPLVREFVARKFFGVNRTLRSADNVVIARNQLRQADHLLAVCRRKAS